MLRCVPGLGGAGRGQPERSSPGRARERGSAESAKALAAAGRVERQGIRLGKAQGKTCSSAGPCAGGEAAFAAGGRTPARLGSPCPRQQLALSHKQQELYRTPADFRVSLAEPRRESRLCCISPGSAQRLDSGK
ncbi:smoothened-like protein [Platysternon megacephalum]|uniref:Smoothened-like protein n=1 Tax=Platysternon megacephalum TaxID=55544 RepID=A0A4D9DXT3_9SAUR|nr:smoothened-like protein [Platysternon megacephalum]